MNLEQLSKPVVCTAIVFSLARNLNASLLQKSMYHIPKTNYGNIKHFTIYHMAYYHYLIKGNTTVGKETLADVIFLTSVFF